ncbi:class A beta-lactamase [Ensifer adhaerens]|uniref:class A beta-lactamase n=1 Tax=Ensifer adhaerens TaxID=106592 RepID=UPI000CF037DA|nr:class A beta-lactamase [Ensifer adhaerens]
MPLLINRRNLLVKSALLYPALMLAPKAAAAGAGSDDIDRRLAELEGRTGGRLGVSVLDTQTNISFGRRENERFAMCSSFKALAAGFILARVDQGTETLDRRIPFQEKDLVTYSPVTEKHVGGAGMTIAELCAATITTSDNTAANLLLDSFGGPSALTAWLRSIGDENTRLDRIEPALNEAKKGDPRDTTTPAAMLDTLGKLTVGSALTESSRKQLNAWMVANTTGDLRIRAGLPAAWRVGDKTGTNATGEASDIAIVWPEGRSPLLITVYIAEATAEVKDLNPIFAEVGRMAAEMV